MYSLLILLHGLVFVTLETVRVNCKKKRIQSKDGMDKAISESLVLNFPLRHGYIYTESLLYKDKSKGDNETYLLFKIYDIDPGNFYGI